MFYISAEGANIHVAHDHALAQVVKSNLESEAYKNVTINSSEKREYTYLDVGGIAAGEKIKLFLDDQHFYFFMSQWPRFKQKFDKWKLKAQKLNRGFFKFYCVSEIVCISEHDINDFTSLVNSLRSKIDHDYAIWMTEDI